MADRNKNNNKSFVIGGTRLMSIFAIALTLFTLGLVGLLQIIKIQLNKLTEEQIVYRLPLPQGVTAQQQSVIIHKFKSQPFTLNVNIISADSMVQVVTRELGDNPVDVLGYNPFSPIICLNLKSQYANPDSIKSVERYVQTILPNCTLNYRRDLLQSIHKGIGKISLILEFLILLQLIITFVQIGNTTKLLIHSKRLHIRTLSLVGASRRFIRRPIVLRAVGDGLMGAVLAIILLALGIYTLDNSMNLSILKLLSTQWIIIEILAILLIAVCISYFAARHTAHRYIKMDGGKINLI